MKERTSRMKYVPVKYPAEDAETFPILARQANTTVSGLLRNATLKALKPWIDKIKAERMAERA